MNGDMIAIVCVVIAVAVTLWLGWYTNSPSKGTDEKSEKEESSDAAKKSGDAV